MPKALVRSATSCSAWCAAFVIYGEAFVALQIGDDGELRLLLLPVAQVDPGFNEDMGEAGWVICSIHIARDGRRLRYRVSLTPPDHPFASIDRRDMARRQRRVARRSIPCFPARCAA